MSLKKAVAKKTVAKKAAKKIVKKVVVKKVAVKKASVKKATVKTISKKTPAKKIVTKKATVKKVAAKKVIVKKAIVKKAVAKKSVVKKVDAKKLVVKKAPAKKMIVNKTSTIKVTLVKSEPKKIVVNVAAKKISAEKATTNNFRNKLVTESNHNEIPSAKQPIEARVTKRTLTQTDALLESVISGLEEKKAKNISLLDLRDLENRVSDYFVIAEGDSNTHVDAISGSVEEMAKKKSNERPYRMEGIENSEWIIIDYVNIVVHIFQREARAYYKLEELWADAKIHHINN